MKQVIKTRQIVLGKTVDEQTRCKHYHSKRDIIAIKFPCCDTYYPCYQCHQECTDHPAKKWSQHQFDELAILCGVCTKEFTIHEYMELDSCCSQCRSTMNPGCQLHWNLYFKLVE